MASTSTSPLPGMTSVLAVVAHPDDESFGLGAIIDTVVRAGGRATVLCFTRGEASTLGDRSNLAVVRATEFVAAAAILGITRTRLLDYPDGRLAATPLPELTDHVTRFATEAAPGHLLVFDTGGVTGHPDHDAATAAARAAAARLHIPVIAWTLPEHVAIQLNTELGTTFTGRGMSTTDWTVRVDRTVQRRAIAAHASQAADNPVLTRRLDLLGDIEHLRPLSTTTG